MPRKPNPAAKRTKSPTAPTKPDKSSAIPPGTAMATYLVHGKPFNESWDFSHHIVPPMSASVTYRLDSAARGACGFADFASAAAHKNEPIFIYDRLDEPTRSMLESGLAQAEGGDICVAFASGMAAISAALGICLQSGDHIICHRAVYGCTYSLLTLWYPRLGIAVDFCDMTKSGEVERLMRPETRVLYTETPVNPTMEIIDIAALRSAADRENARRDSESRPVRVIIDNTFATPFGQRPLSLGADIVCHSLTKNIGGFGTDMGGAVITNAALEGEVLVWRKDFGGALASRVAWNMLAYGLPTLPLRLLKQSHSAQVVAEWLAQHPAVSRVAYPGLRTFPQSKLARKQMVTPEGAFLPGSIIYFETREPSPTSHANAERLVNFIAKHAYCITLAVSLGQLRTLIENPGSMTHSALPLEQQISSGIAPNGVRLSLGIEDPRDIIRDLETAFAAL
jgi:methionine-gamma-lyase